MGVYIRSIKPTKFLNTFEDVNAQNEEVVANAFPLYCLGGFEPTKHLTQFQWGYWECESGGKSMVNVPYSMWGAFRDFLAYLVDESYKSEDFWHNSNDEFVNKPFYELINFADNEGAFDYTICEELLKDFTEYYDKAHQLYDNNVEEMQLSWDCYNNIMNVIKECVECKGVVYFS